MNNNNNLHLTLFQHTKSNLNTQTKMDSIGSSDMVQHKAMRRRLRARYFTGGGSWNDPEKITFNVLLAIVYVVGLLAFQKYTGLLDLKTQSKAGPGSDGTTGSVDSIFNPCFGLCRPATAPIQRRGDPVAAKL